MVVATCVKRFKNDKGLIVGYRIMDKTGKSLNIASDRLKDEIRSNKIKVSNLTLTSDNRLMLTNGETWVDNGKPVNKQNEMSRTPEANKQPEVNNIYNDQSMYMSWDRLLSTKRQVNKNNGVDLSNFNISEFDMDLMTIYSNKSFRRLEDKTQVFPLDGSDFVRTRLTHSLEVSNIAKEIAVMITQDKDGNPNKLFVSNPNVVKNLPTVAACAGLLHDIGNPPFGHYGETFIRSFFEKKFRDDNFKFRGRPVKDILTEQMKQDFINFEGNAQALRIMSKCKEAGKFYNDKYGFIGMKEDYYRIGNLEYDLNLTYAVMNSIIKYPNPSTDFDPKSSDVKRHKIGYYHAEEELMKGICNTTGTYLNGRYVRHPVVFILEAADDIAYSTADLEDSFIKNKFSIKEFTETFEKEANMKLDKRIEDFKNKQADDSIKEKIDKYVGIRKDMQSLSKLGPEVKQTYAADTIKSLDNKRKALFKTESEKEVLSALETFIKHQKFARNLIGALKKMMYTTNLGETQAEIKETSYIMFRNWLNNIRMALVIGAAQSFIANYQKIMSGTFYGDLFEGTPSEDVVATLKKIMLQKVYLDEKVRATETSGVTIVEGLLEKYIEYLLYFDEEEEGNGINPYELSNRGIPYEYRAEYIGFKKDCLKNGKADEAEFLYHKLLMLTDFISGITDSYAQKLYDNTNNARV